MRGAVPDLPSPSPMGAMLPGIYQDDDLMQRFVAGLDDVLAPVLSTLDNISAYVDPRTAPDDFLAYLAGWLGIELEDTWPARRRREALQQAVRLHRRRGTAAGIRAAVRLAVDAPVDVMESGASAWSQRPGAAIPGRGSARIVVRIGLPELSPLDLRRIDAIIGAVKPAHVLHIIELATPPPAGSESPQGSPDLGGPPAEIVAPSGPGPESAPLPKPAPTPDQRPVGDTGPMKPVVVEPADDALAGPDALESAEPPRAGSPPARRQREEPAQSEGTSPLTWRQESEEQPLGSGADPRPTHDGAAAGSTRGAAGEHRSSPDVIPHEDREPLTADRSSRPPEEDLGDGPDGDKDGWGS